MPFLGEVGYLWEQHQWTEDQEHFSTMVVREFLFGKMSDLPEPPSQAPLLLTSCVHGERHDLMLVVAMLSAKQSGWATAFLGPEPAPLAVERAVSRLHPRAVLLSVTTNVPFTDHRDGTVWLENLNQFAGCTSDIRFLIGGPLSVVSPWTAPYPHLHPVQSLAQLIQMLEDLETSNPPGFFPLLGRRPPSCQRMD